jgi:hypothetical protein
MRSAGRENLPQSSPPARRTGRTKYIITITITNTNNDINYK